MNLQHQTILITGGSSGLGLEMAVKLIAKQNKVLICGRSAEKLDEIKIENPELEVFQCDLAKKEDCERLAEWVTKNFPECNILINNAAIVYRTNFHTDDEAIAKAEHEFHVNFLAPLILTKLLLPVLRQNQSPAIINITTGLIYAPKSAYSFYNATKAALHAFTQTLRLQMRNTGVSVTEVMFPAVNTPWHKGNPPSIAIEPREAVEEMISKLEKGKPEIRIAGVKILYLLSRIAPGFAIKKINQL